MAKKPYFQAAGQRGLKRSDHVWACYKDQDGGGKHFLCVLCGAVTFETPPQCPTPEEWLPHHYRPLTEGERALSPVEDWR